MAPTKTLILRDYGPFTYFAMEHGTDSESRRAVSNLQSSLLVQVTPGEAHDHPWADGDELLNLLEYSPPEFRDKGWLLRFPRGRREHVQDRLERHGFRVDFYPMFEPGPPPPEYAEIRAKLLDDIRRAASDAMLEHATGIVKTPPRFGKMYGVAAAFRGWGSGSTLVVCPRAAVIRQAVNDLPDFIGEEVGHICGSIGKPNVQPMTWATPNSLVNSDDPRFVHQRWVEYLSQVENLVFDEVHIGGAMAFTVAAACINRKRQWGTSATPWVNDVVKDTTTAALTGPVRVAMNYQTAAACGILADVQVRWYEVSYPFSWHDESRLRGMPWAQYYGDMIVDNIGFHRSVADIANYHVQAGDPVVIFVDRVAHGKALLRFLPHATGVIGKMSTREADRIKQDFNAGEIKMVIATKRWREGVTLRANVVINAEGGKADHVSAQRSGRGALPKDDNRAMLLYDFTHRDVPRSLLHAHSMDRYRYYKTEGWQQDVVGTLSSEFEVLA